MPAAVTYEGFTSVQYDKWIDGKIQDFTVKVAETVLRDAVAKGFDNEPVVITDGMPGRDWTQVKPFGKIEWARRPVLKDCAIWIMSELIAKSPVGPGRNGHYRDKHIFMINNAQVDASALDSLKPSDRVEIVNTQPYAKKLEGSKAERKYHLKRERGSSAQAPAGVYQVVQRAAVSKYGRSLFIDFKYVKLNTGAAQVMRMRTHGKKLRHPYKVEALFPCLQLRLLQNMQTIN